MLPKLLGFLQLSLYKISSTGDFHLPGRDLSSCLSSLSLEDNKQTMQTLHWKAFSWAGKLELEAGNDSCKYYSAPPQHDKKSKDESCAFPAS